MFVPFNSLPPEARIWIYQSDRKFTREEKTIINSQLQLFTEGWAAHGNPLKTSFDIRYDQFVMLAADESYAGASGCSIDDSVRTVQAIAKQIGVDLFNRNLVAFMPEKDVKMVPLTALKQAYLQGLWNESTPVFNNVIQTRKEVEQNWLVPAGTTWVKRYMSSEKVAG
jgi:hypothetical protein